MNRKSKTAYSSIWDRDPGTITAKKDLELILGSVKNLPLEYWRANFFFKGADNKELYSFTQGRFPVKGNHAGTHPVFALKPVLGGAGFTVCPCSSAWQKRKTKWIEKGTRLLHTGKIMDKRSYLIKQIRFNIPASEAVKLRFMGEVPEAAIMPVHKEDGS